MNDRGEKIVSLAREMLRAEQPGVPAEPRLTLSFKALCFATILSALGGSLLTGWNDEARRPLNHYEKVELDALVFYAARVNGVSEDAVRRQVESRVGLGDFADFSQRDYRRARDYLRGTIR